MIKFKESLLQDQLKRLKNQSIDCEIIKIKDIKKYKDSGALFKIKTNVRGILQKKYNIKKIKVGHAGTLDPLAEGLLIVCTGKMTKRIIEFQNLNKTYTGKCYLGASTPSFDLETEIIEKKSIDHLNDDIIQQAATEFKGKILQTPPIYSAIKHKGKKLYEFARKGETIDIKRVYQLYH